MPIIEIVNVVATASIGDFVDIDDLVQIPNIDYNPAKHRCAYYKDETMESKISIFSSGKLISGGAKSEKSAKRDLLHTARILSKLNKMKNCVSGFSVQNVVITVNIERPIDLDIIQDAFPGTVYEPEQFPGAIIRPYCHDVSVLAFGPGKLVIAGLKSTQELYKMVSDILDELSLSF